MFIKLIGWMQINSALLTITSRFAHKVTLLGICSLLSCFPFLISLGRVVLSPYSHSAFAQSRLKARGYINGVIEIPYATYSSNGRPIPVPQGEWESENHFNSCMYSIFASIFQDTMVVNSETTQWLEVNQNSRNGLKPDFFLFPSALPEFLSPGSTCETYPTPAFYGKPNDKCAFLVDVVFEGTLGPGQITNEQIGQLFEYLEAMCETGSQHPRGIIYNSSEFIFAEYEADQLIDTLKCQWVMPGAWELLEAKIRPSYWNPMVNVLLTLKLSEGWTFHRVLGRGRFGLVCEASHNSNHYALKIVGSHLKIISAEFERLVQCNSDYPDLVVAPTPNSLTIIGDGGYYTMDEIGIKAYLPARKIFLLLYQLHDRGIIHGDPRIANVITLPGPTHKWIDFRSQGTNRFYDLKILVESVNLRSTKDTKKVTV